MTLGVFMSSFVNETQVHSHLHYFTNLLPLSIHSHIQRPILAEGEASLSLIHLHGGTASVQQDSINASWLNVHIRQQGLQLAESANNWFDATTGERIRERNGTMRYLHIDAYGTAAVKLPTLHWWNWARNVSSFCWHPVFSKVQLNWIPIQLIDNISFSTWLKKRYESDNKLIVREKYITLVTTPVLGSDITAQNLYIE